MDIYIPTHYFLISELKGVITSITSTSYNNVLSCIVVINCRGILRKD